MGEGFLPVDVDDDVAHNDDVKEPSQLTPCHPPADERFSASTSSNIGRNPLDDLPVKQN